MNNEPSEDTKLLREIKNLLTLIAEPQIAARDQGLRAALLDVVGKSKKGQAAVLLMNGQHSRIEIARTAGIDQGQLSRLVARMRELRLLEKEIENPTLVIPVSQQLFSEVS